MERGRQNAPAPFQRRPSPIDLWVLISFCSNKALLSPTRQLRPPRRKGQPAKLYYGSCPLFAEPDSARLMDLWSVIRSDDLSQASQPPLMDGSVPPHCPRPPCCRGLPEYSVLPWYSVLRGCPVLPEWPGPKSRPGLPEYPNLKSRPGLPEYPGQEQTVRSDWGQDD